VYTPAQLAAGQVPRLYFDYYNHNNNRYGVI
jgi:hypothetical protein